MDKYINKEIIHYEYGIQYVAMDGCGHSPQSQHPDQFAYIIRGFLLDVD